MLCMIIVYNLNMSYYSTYRWCAVPECKNTSVKTPNKLWIRVPTDLNMRKTWFALAKRNPELLCEKTRLYFCEDHFNLEYDMENYIQYKIMGSVKKIRMNPHCIPSRFVWNIKHKSASNESHPADVKMLTISISKDDVQDHKEENNVKASSSCIMHEDKSKKIMEPRTSRKDYRNHHYSGPLKSRKRVHGQMKRYHGEIKSRNEVWCKKLETNDNPGSSSSITGQRLPGPLVKVYARKDKQIKQSTEIENTVHAKTTEVLHVDMMMSKQSHEIAIKEEANTKQVYAERDKEIRKQSCDIEPQKKMEITKVKCCCCLDEDGDSCLWSLEKNSDSDNIYGKLLHECFCITIGNPICYEEHKICHECIGKLEQAVQFKRQVLECQQKLSEPILDRIVISSASECDLSDGYYEMSDEEPSMEETKAPVPKMKKQIILSKQKKTKRKEGLEAGTRQELNNGTNVEMQSKPDVDESITENQSDDKLNDSHILEGAEPEPEPKPELELEPELKPELELEPKPELNPEVAGNIPNMDQDDSNEENELVIKLENVGSDDEDPIRIVDPNVVKVEEDCDTSSETLSVLSENEGDDAIFEYDNMAIQEDEVEAEPLQEAPDPLNGINLVHKEEIDCVSSTIDDSKIDVAKPVQAYIGQEVNAVKHIDSIFNCTLREMLSRPCNILQDMNRRGNDMLQNLNDQFPMPHPRPGPKLRTVRKLKRPCPPSVSKIEEPNTSREQSSNEETPIPHPRPGPKVRTDEKLKRPCPPSVSKIEEPNTSREQSSNEETPMPCLRSGPKLRTVENLKRPCPPSVSKIEEPKPNTREQSKVKKVVSNYLDLLR